MQERSLQIGPRIMCFSWSDHIPEEIEGSRISPQPFCLNLKSSSLFTLGGNKYPEHYIIWGHGCRDVAQQAHSPKRVRFFSVSIPLPVQLYATPHVSDWPGHTLSHITFTEFDNASKIHARTNSRFALDYPMVFFFLNLLLLLHYALKTDGRMAGCNLCC